MIRRITKTDMLILIATLIFSTCSILYSLSLSYFLALLYGNTITIYSLTIGTYMLFLGLGAFLYYKLNTKIGAELLLYTEILLVLVAYFGPLLVSYISALDISYTVKMYVSFGILGLIGILSGVELPFLMGLAEEDEMPSIIGIDYFGGLIGSLGYVFFFLPNINTVKTFHVIAIFNLVTAILFYILYKKFKEEKISYKPVVFALVLGILLVSFSNKIVKTSEEYFINKRLQLKVYL